MNKQRTHIAILFIAIHATSCGDGVITFPVPDPAQVRIVNVTQNVPTVRVIFDSTIVVDAQRGKASNFAQVAAGRPIAFTLGSPSTVFRSNLRYTLGGNARVILFARGDTNGLVEFRREIQDTTIPSQSPNSVIRFTHMAENVDKAYFVEVWSNGTRLMAQDYEPGISSPAYTVLQPGTYSFEIREAGTTNVLATLKDVTITAARSYMLYTYDRQQQATDNITLDIF
ncbi:MAG: DUF4397 domain-containing protein [Ignavibacteria bacterium]|nr:DUF4397 domain-containing protein [Ignavibacteria bacterium]